MIADFFSSLLPSPKASLEDPRFNLNDPAAYEALGAQKSDSGISVSWEDALTLPAFWQGISIISGDFATSTANVYRRTKDRDREIDTSHPADFLISDSPNDEMDAFELWRRHLIHVLIWQNAYLFTDRNGGVGPPIGLYNLLPDRTAPARDDRGKLFYKTEVDGELVYLKAEDVIHTKGLSINYGIGMELIKSARNSLGLSLAAQGFGSKFFANGAQAGGVIEVPLGMQGDAAEKVAQGIQKKFSSKENWFRMMVLRDGVKFHQTTIDAQKSQLTELRDQQVRDTARFLNLTPHKLGIKDSVSYNSAEQSQIEYITGCLTHWFSTARGAAQKKLLTEKERRNRTHFIDFNTSKLIERDLKTQVEILQIERQNEIINAAEWRRKLNMSPRTDAAADLYFNPHVKSNETSLNGEPEPATEPAPAKPAKPAKNTLTPAARIVCEDAISRITRRVTSHARNTSKNPAKLTAWLDTKAYDHRDVFHQMIMPAATLVAESLNAQGDDICYAWGGKFFAGLVTMLDTVTKPPYLAKDLEKNVDEQCVLFEATACASLLGSLIRSDDNV